ncbi:AT-rich interactive domain-containing protein 5A [Pleurodeles waltl]|uniref:AT-rich interactive domain-containing protein 5A n=1 Tax=Pleurodeles waltl TaxID=8319 RepID=UPI00370952C0
MLAYGSTRLVLPYVQYLRGEDDKLILISKPMKRCNASKESKSEEAAEKRMNPKQGADNAEHKTEERMQEGQPTSILSKEEASQQVWSKNESDLCWCQKEIPNVNCCSLTLPRAYKSLFTTLHVNENHSILSPLAKKKLLSQTSKAETLLYHGQHSSLCLKVKQAKLDNGELTSRIPDKEIQYKPDIYLSQEVTSSGLEQSSQESASPHFNSGVLERQERGSTHLHRKDSCMPLLSGFHMYKSKEFNLSACRSMPSSDHSFLTSKNFSEPPLQWKEAFANGPEIGKQEKDPSKSRTSWRMNKDTPFESDKRGPPAYMPPLFHKQTAFWVHPMAYSAGLQTEQGTQSLLHTSANPLTCHSAESVTKEELNKSSVQGEPFRVVSPFQQEGNKKVHQNVGISKGIQPAICRPKPVKPCMSYSAAINLSPRMNNGGIKPGFGANFHHSTESLKNPSISLSLIHPLPLSPWNEVLQNYHVKVF